MKISVNWLKKFVKFQQSPPELAHMLTMAGLEVESCETVSLSNRQTDTVMELGLTPNRPDCLSIYGVAREIAALTGNGLRDIRFDLKESGDAVEEMISVELEQPDKCPRYLTRVITDVKVGPSPAWLRELLEAVGQRSINNVVDVTNFVMLELGNPLHAFDYSLLKESRIKVRSAAQGEEFTTIGRTQCRLHEDVLVIADGERAVALAGIMGGFNSEVREETETVLLECAYFHPGSIRKTSKEYKIHSESSHRFERGTDPNNLGKIIDYAASLIAETSGGRVAVGRIDKYPSPINRAKIRLRVSRVNKILGGSLKLDEIRGFLKTLSFDVKGGEDGRLMVSVPTFRPDITREIDLIEEVARLYGYENTRPELPICHVTQSDRPPLSLFKKMAQDILAGFGFQEIITYSCINRECLGHLRLSEDDPLRRAVPIINPISQEMDILRTTLVPGMLQTMAANIKSGAVDMMFFETGKIFLTGEPGEIPIETTQLVAAVTEKVERDLWTGHNYCRDFYSIKGALQALGERINALPLDLEPCEATYLLPGKSVRIKAGGVNIGKMGEVHPQVLEHFDIGQVVFLFELSLPALFEKVAPTSTLESIHRHPSNLRDTSIVVDETARAEEIEQAIRKVGGGTLKNVSVFDLFAGGSVPAGKKCLSFSLVFRSDSRTLTDEEVDLLQQRILQGLENNFGARLR